MKKGLLEVNLLQSLNRVFHAGTCFTFVCRPLLYFYDLVLSLQQSRSSCR